MTKFFPRPRHTFLACALLALGAGTSFAQAVAPEDAGAAPQPVRTERPAAPRPAEEPSKVEAPATASDAARTTQETDASTNASAPSSATPTTVASAAAPPSASLDASPRFEFRTGDARRARRDEDASDFPADEDGPQSGGTSGQSGQTGNQFQPLTGEEKMKRALKSSFLSPAPYAVSLFTAAITQFGEDRLPHKDGGDEVADWGSRAARNFATRTTRNIFTSGIYATLFRQDPRYDRSTKKGFGPRALHAVSRVFVTRDDDGNIEPNYSRFAGSMTASAMANIWEHSTPGHDRIGTDATLKRFARFFLNDAITNIVFKEFWRDISKIFGR